MKKSGDQSYASGKIPGLAPQMQQQQQQQQQHQHLKEDQAGLRQRQRRAMDQAHEGIETKPLKTASTKTSFIVRDDGEMMDGGGRSDYPYCEVGSEVYFDLIAKDREETIDEFGRPVPWLDRVSDRLSDKGWLVGAHAQGTALIGTDMAKGKGQQQYQDHDHDKDRDRDKSKDQGKSKGGLTVKELLSAGSSFRKAELTYKISLPCPLPARGSGKASVTHYPTNDVFVLDGAFPSDWCDRLSPSPAVGMKYDLPGFEVVVVSERLAIEIFAKVELWLPKVLIVKEESFALACVVPLFRFMKVVPKTNAAEAEVVASVKPIRHENDEEDDTSRVLSKHPISGKPGRFRSLVTIAIYLNDGEEYEGGELTFLYAWKSADSDAAEYSDPMPPLHSLEIIGQVQPVRGRCVIFQLDQRHEFKNVISGTKLIFQCDVAFEQIGLV